MKSINNFKNQERSFTIIELLVVIAVIGLLAAIVIVAISGVRERAQLSRTASWAATNHRMLSADNVLNLNFDNCLPNTTPTSFTDLSGFNNNGTCDLAGGRCPLCADGVPGVSGRAVSFDGVNDTIVRNPATINLSHTNVVTLSFWMNKDFTTPERVTFELTNDFNSFTDGFVFVANSGPPCDGFIQIGLRGNIDYNVACYTRPLSHIWHHYTVVYNKGLPTNEVNLHINGILLMPNSRTHNTNNTNNFGNRPFFIMSRGGIGWFDSGLLDDVRIYSAAMPLAYIQEQYLQGLQSLLANNGITEQEYNQRIAEFNKHLAKK